MWILPSRNRPDRVAKMFDIAPSTTWGTLAVDDDQIDMYRYIKLPAGWRLDISPRCPYVEKHNYVFKKYPYEPWYGSLSDDMVPITPGWDLKLIERAGRRGIAYADDLYTRRCGAFAIGGDLVRVLGFIFPPEFIHYYGDTTMELLVKEFNLAGMQKDIIIEHRHYGNKNNPGRHDQTSKERPKLADERRVWHEWLLRSWPAVRERAQAAISGA